MKTYCLELTGPYACFTRPEMKVERVSYDTPPGWLQSIRTGASNLPRCSSLSHPGWLQSGSIECPTSSGL